MVIKIKRGDIVFVDLNPARGSEQRGIRPVLVLQNNISNKYSPVVIVAAITSKVFNKDFPTCVFVSKKDSKLDRDSTILLNQIRTLDKSRIIKKAGSLDNSIIKKVDRAIKNSLDLD